MACCAIIPSDCVLLSWPELTRRVLWLDLRGDVVLLLGRGGGTNGSTEKAGFPIEKERMSSLPSEMLGFLSLLPDDRKSSDTVD